MTWFAFKGYNNGQAVDLAGSQEKEAAALGFHGYATQAQAQAEPNSVNVLNSWAVNEIVADYKIAVEAGEQPGGPNATPTPGNIVAGEASLAENSIPGVRQIATFLGDLGSRNLWLRVGKVVIGIALIIVGLVHLTGAGNIAADVAKGAAFA
jgi:hypothetical protein